MDLGVDHAEDRVLGRLAVQEPLAERVDPLPLLVHDLVVFEEVLPGVEVALLDLLLGPLDPPGDHLALDRLALLHPEPGQDVGDPLAGELPHQVVFEREEEPRRARVALAARPAPELVVDPPALVPLGADDVQAAERGDLAPLGLHLGLVLADGRLPDLLGDFQAGRVERPAVLVLQALQVGPGHELGVAAEDDVGPSAGHVGGDRDRPLPPGLGDDLGLALVVLGVEDLVA